MFTTVLHNLKSPTNVGTIIRTHVAFAGTHLIMVGHERPWRFKKGTQAFSRKLEKLCSIIHLKTDDQFFQWCHENDATPLALEISNSATPLPQVTFPKHPAFIVGNEATGLPTDFLNRCHQTLIIPQFGPAPCLNVATTAALAIYEFNRTKNPNQTPNPITQNKFTTAPRPKTYPV